MYEKIKYFFDVGPLRCRQFKALIESAFGVIWSSVDYKFLYDNAYEELFKKIL